MLSQFQNKTPSSLIDFLKGIIHLDDEHIELYQKLNLLKVIHFINISKRPANKIVQRISLSEIKNSKIATVILVAWSLGKHLR